MFGDNQGALSFPESPDVDSRSKHSDIHKHFERENIAEGTVDLQYTQQSAKLLRKDSFVE